MENYISGEIKIAGYDRFDCGVDTVEFTRKFFKNMHCILEYYQIIDWQAEVIETFNLTESDEAVEYYNERVPEFAAITEQLVVIKENLLWVRHH